MAKKDDRVSPANYLSLLGLAAIGVVIFFGSMIKSIDGSLTISIITAVAAVALLGGSLWWSIRAKSATDNPDKWRYVEWLAIAAYVVVAVFFAQPFIRFFYVLGEKGELQQQAKNEVEYVHRLHSTYDEQRKEGIARAKQMLIDFNQSGKVSYDSYITKVAPDPEWAETATEVTAIPIDSKVNELSARIDAWDLFDLPSMANDMDGLGESSLARMKEKIRQYGDENKLIPVIHGSAGGGQFRKTGLVEFDLPAAPESTFTASLRSADGFSVIGLVVYVLLNLLVLLNLWVTRRSNYVGPGSTRVGGSRL